MTTTTETRVYAYEAMFLISQSVASDFGGVVSHIREGLERYGAEIVAMKKWDERRLAYEIAKNKRGVYILAYFKVDTKNMAQIERFFNLSEKILRFLIIRADHLTEDEMRAADGQKDLEVEARMRAERGAGAPARAPEEPAPASEPTDAEPA